MPSSIHEIDAFADNHVSISVGDYHAGDDINLYLDDLQSNPDKVGYYVNEEGKIIRKDEFDL